MSAMDDEEEWLILGEWMNRDAVEREMAKLRLVARCNASKPVQVRSAEGRAPSKEGEAMKLQAWSEQVELNSAADGFRHFGEPIRHYYADGQEITESEYNALLAGQVEAT